MGIGSSSLLCPVMESVRARMGRKRKDAKLERIGSARSGRNLQVGIYVSSSKKKPETAVLFICTKSMECGEVN